MKNILIIGGSSALGKYLIDAHLLDGDRVISTSRNIRNKKYDASEQFNEIKYDLLDESDLIELLNLSHSLDGFDKVYCVASAVPANCNDTDIFFKTNVVGYDILLNNIELKFGALIVYMSSMSCYQPVDGCLDHSSPLVVDQSYPASKNLMSFVLQEIVKRRRNNIRAISFIIPTLLTVGNPNNFFINWTNTIFDKSSINIFNPDAPFNACIDAKNIFKIARAIYCQSSFVQPKIFLAGQVTTLRNIFLTLVNERLLSEKQLQVINNDRPSTTLPITDIKKLKISVPQISDMLINEIKTFRSSK